MSPDGVVPSVEPCADATAVSSTMDDVTVKRRARVVALMRRAAASKLMDKAPL